MRGHAEDSGCGHRSRPRNPTQAYYAAEQGQFVWEVEVCRPCLSSTKVEDVDHWLKSPKREEVFGPAGYTLRTFVDPNDPHTVGLIFEGPGLEKLQEMLQTDEVQEAGEICTRLLCFDTLRMLFVER